MHMPTTVSAVRVLSIAAVLLTPAHPARADGVGSVRYKVTYATGRVRTLDGVPETNAGIRSVVRISRTPGPTSGYIVLSTGPRMLTEVPPARTFTTELKWDGGAWVAPGEAARPQPGPASRPGATSRPAADAERLGQAEKELADARARLKVCDEAVTLAAEQLTKARRTDKAPAAMLLLESAQRARQECLGRIARGEAALAALKSGRPAIPRATGRVTPAGPGPAPPRALGVVRPIRRRAVLGHRVQVWKLHPAGGHRTYRVSMAHPEAGRFGAFHYVAYADTDADGRPDTLIARSPLARADRPGQWTRWTFTTDRAAVFVGNEWEHQDTTLYCRRAGRTDPNWRGMGTEVYVSGLFGGIPFRRRRGWPFLTNLRVRVAQSEPDDDDEPVRIIVGQPRSRPPTSP